jgi:bacterial/archaeal transporter family-2 protein
MTRSALFLMLWTLLAGAGIPLIGILNGGMARAVGNPFGATAVMFTVALIAALALALPLHGPPTLAQISTAPAASYAAGLLIGFYALSATIIIPRFGAGNFVAFILIAQLLAAAVIDQFGLLGVPRNPLDATKMCGFALIVAGVVVLQLASRKTGTT